MIYLESFTLPSQKEEDNFILHFPYQFEMQCFTHTSAYPFKIFPRKNLSKLEFEPITFLYGSNGSGKSTLLNVIAGKLKLNRVTPYNNSPLMDDYVKLCSYRLSGRSKTLPEESSIITSDGVFDFLLDMRAVNQGIDRKRNELFDEFDAVKDPNCHFTLNSLDDYEKLRHHIEIKRKTKSEYVSGHLPLTEREGHSNGESAFMYFTEKIKENALYLLDEPENSLSAKFQKELIGFLEDSVRFYNCQFVISTHSPFLLSMKGAKIYDLDDIPVRPKKWNELESIRLYNELFASRRTEFN